MKQQYKNEIKIEEMKPSQYPLLQDFLYEAIFVPQGMQAPPKSILQEPDLQVYVSDFGTYKDDIALSVKVNDIIVGAVWVRIMMDYGHVYADTPSLAISLLKEYRGKGIGMAMMKQMLRILKKRGYAQVSLSVQKENFAVRMYQKLGFKILEDKEDEYLMIKTLHRRIMKFSPEYGTTCLWICENDLYEPADYEELRLPEELIRELAAFDEGIMGLIDWKDPGGPSPMSSQERERLYRQGYRLFEKTREVLKDRFEVVNEMDWIK